MTTSAEDLLDSVRIDLREAEGTRSMVECDTERLLGLLETLLSARYHDRCFDAAFKALTLLDGVRYMWNGPIHRAVGLLRDATGPQPESAPSEKGESKTERLTAAYCAANDYINAMLNSDVPPESLAKIAATYWQRVKEV